MTDRNIISRSRNGKSVVDDTLAFRRMDAARVRMLEAFHRWSAVADPRERQIEADATARMMRELYEAEMRRRSL